MRALLHGAIVYTRTDAYFKSLVSGLTVFAIQIILLSIAIPTLMWAIRTIRSRRFRVTIDFHLFQVFHRVTRMFLSMASSGDILPMLLQEQQRNPKFEVGSHSTYGNLENILFALGKIFGEGDRLWKSLETKTVAEFQGYLAACNRCMDDIDRLLGILSNLPREQQELFKTRMLAYVLRDHVENVVTEMSASGPNQLPG
jgi:hypothetical protein